MTTKTKTQDLKKGDQIEAYGMVWEVISIQWGEITARSFDGNVIGFAGFSFEKING